MITETQIKIEFAIAIQITNPTQFPRTAIPAYSPTRHINSRLFMVKRPQVFAVRSMKCPVSRAPALRFTIHRVDDTIKTCEADVAQLVEQPIRNRQVSGSSPLVGSSAIAIPH